MQYVVFDAYVSNANSSLKNDIIRTELSKLIAKCLAAYRMMIEHIGNKGFWDVCPDYFKENRDAMNENTDYIHMFLSLGPEDNSWGDGRYMYFIRDTNSSMLLEDFKKKFFNWMRFKHPNVKYRWTQDYSAFKRKGFDISRTNICKMCMQEARPDCCYFYDRSNRTTRVIIKYIRCIDNNEDF